MSLETIAYQFLSDNKTILGTNYTNSNNITNNDERNIMKSEEESKK